MPRTAVGLTGARALRASIQTAGSYFFAPLGVELLPDVCDLEDPPGGNFLEPCFTVQRQALRFTLAGESLDVYDHGVDTLPPYALAVQTAELRHDITCTDTNDTWYSWLVAPPPPQPAR